MLRSFRRTISILQVPAQTTQPIPSTTTTPANIQDVENLSEYKSLEVARMKCLGNPQSILSIDSPPSVPVYVRKGSLLSLYGTNSLAVKSNLQFLLPLSRLFYGGYASFYQKLHSTTPFSALISSSTRTLFKKSRNNTFAKLVLDGKNDWAILNKQALQLYTGNSLNINMFKLPAKVSSKLVKRVGEVSTGLPKWNRLGYTLLSGRGQVGLVGNGSIYSINISQDEELLINYQNLLAITVNGPHDLQNCIARHSFPVEQQIEPTPKNNFEHYWYKIKSWFSSGKSSTQNFLVGNREFVRIIGPRNLLLESDQPHLEAPKLQMPSFAYPVQPKLQDYLSYAEVTPDKKITLRSTPDFKETLAEMDKR